MEYEIHPIQAAILRVLLFNPRSRYTDLNTTEITSDHFNFHVKRVIELELVSKLSDGTYALTAKGKEFASRFDVDSKEVKFEKQAKIAVLVGCMKGEGEDRRYLMQQRLKEPYYGFYGFVSGKVKIGEAVVRAGERELLEETGLEADLSLIAVRHKTDRDLDGNLLEDKFFFVLRGENTRGNIGESFEGGKNIWMTQKEIESLPDLFPDVLSIIDNLNEKNIKYIEEDYQVKKY